jgi:hypothetical protein
MELLLPVSIGEGLDKLTILELKMKYIANEERKKDVKKEYDSIFPILKDYKEKCEMFYKVLYDCNEKIWVLCDDTRDKNNIDYASNCEKIILENDKRFRIKNKINNKLNSNLKEQKGYNKKKALFISHLGLGDMIVMCGAVRYYSIIYDEVYVVCKDTNYNNVCMMYSDDDNIKVIKIDGSQETSIVPQLVKDYKNNCDLFLSGVHKERFLNINPKPYNSIQKWFYDDLDLDISIMKEYFMIPSLKESEMLFEKIPKLQNYVFIHNCSSNKKITIDITEFKKNNILVINPNINMYNLGDNMYELANEFIGHPILYYIEIISKANELHLVDSSFSCICGLYLNKKNIVQKKYIYARNNARYPDLFDNTWTYI